MKHWLKRNYYRIKFFRQKLKVGRRIIFNMKNHFEGCNVIENDCLIDTSNIGLGTYICNHSVIKGTNIGKFCSIGASLQTGLGIHPTDTFVSTHPAFFSTQEGAGFAFVKTNIFKENKFTSAEDKYIVEIGNDVWIGNSVIILDGIKIGDGAIIGAGSIVTKDVLPYAIVAGNPARLIKFRFSEHQIEKLLNIKWWNWTFEEIETKSALFANIDAFIAHLGN